MRYAVVTVILAGLAALFIRWVGDALNWAEWVALGVIGFVALMAWSLGVVSARADEEMARQYRDRMRSEWFVPEEGAWPRVERRSEDRSLRHPGLGR